jgi:putative ABC transport system permease protein
MSQAVRERIPDLAVLKAVGFTDGSVLTLVLAESLLMCLIGGAVGMLLSLGAMSLLAKLPGNFLPLSATPGVWAFAASSVVGLGLLVGIVPALSARHLSIVEALAAR